MMSHYESVETMLSDVNLGLLSLDGFKLRRLAKQGRKHGILVKETIPKDLSSKNWSGYFLFPEVFVVKVKQIFNFLNMKRPCNSSFILLNPVLQEHYAVFNLLFDCELYRDPSLLLS